MVRWEMNGFFMPTCSTVMYYILTKCRRLQCHADWHLVPWLLLVDSIWQQPSKGVAGCIVHTVFNYHMSGLKLPPSVFTLWLSANISDFPFINAIANASILVVVGEHHGGLKMGAGVIMNCVSVSLACCPGSTRTGVMMG